MSTKIAVTKQVDDEINAECQLVMDMVKDIKAKSSWSQVSADAIKDLMVAASDLQNSATDVAASADDQFMIGGTLAAVAGLFLFPKAQ